MKIDISKYVIEIEKRIREIRLKTDGRRAIKFIDLVEEVLDNNVIRLRERRIKGEDGYVVGARYMGRNDNEIHIWLGLTLSKMEETLIYEIVGAYYNDQGISIKADLLEAIAQRIWQNRECRGLIRSILKREKRKLPKKWWE